MLRRRSLLVVAVATLFAGAAACAACTEDEVVVTPPSTTADAGAFPRDLSPRPPAPSSPDASAPTGAADATDAAVPRALLHTVGRLDQRDPKGPRFGWPGSELRMHFTGPALALDLADTGASWWEVTIDGTSRPPLVVSGAPASYVVAADLAPGDHEAVLVKRTETALGVTQLLGVIGTLVPSPIPAGRRIEIVGDSITCGFGVLGADETSAFSAETESEPLAFGALAARDLGALHTSIAVSGKGVYRNFGGETTETMPALYPRALANDETSTWDHSFVPDVVVVALGTNDFSGGKGDPGPPFRAAYDAFLATLRATHPSAHLVAVTSPMLDGANHVAQRGYLEAAVAARRAAGDLAVSFLDMEEQRAEDGLGCGFHPSRTTQRKMADRLAAHVRSVLGW